MFFRNAIETIKQYTGVSGELLQGQTPTFFRPYHGVKDFLSRGTEAVLTPVTFGLLAATHLLDGVISTAQAVYENSEDASRYLDFLKGGLYMSGYILTGGFSTMINVVNIVGSGVTTLSGVQERVIFSAQNGNFLMHRDGRLEPIPNEGAPQNNM